MANQSRFLFPGVTFVAAKDTTTHEVEVIRIEDGGNAFVLELIRKMGNPNFNFLVAAVADSAGKPLWGFKSTGFTGLGLLAKAGDETVIALVGSGRDGKVERVIPLVSLISGGPADLVRLANLKREAAKFLGREHQLSPLEAQLLKASIERQREEQEAVERVAAEAREAARMERIRKLLARGQVTGYTADGKSRYGLPVLETEWMSCSPGTLVIVVKTIDEKTGAVGEMIEAFKVLKERGKNPTKGYAMPVTAQRPEIKTEKQAVASAVLPMASTAIEKDGGVYEVLLFATMDDLRLARAGGLNSGTYAAVKPAQTGGPIEVYAVHADRTDTIGKFMPLI